MVLITEIARTLLKLAAPAHRQEAAITRAAERMGMKCQVFSTPTAVFVALGEGADQHCFMVREFAGDINLAQFSEVHTVLSSLNADEVTLGNVQERLKRLNQQPFNRHWLLHLLAFVVTSASVMTLFGGSLWNIAAAALIGLQTGALALLCGRSESASRLTEPLCAAAASATSIMLANFAVPYTELAPLQLTAAGLIVLIPGLTLTVAMRELAGGQWIAGSARLSGALISFLLIVFGVMLGSAAAGGWTSTIPTLAPPEWFSLIPALLASAFGFTVLFRARWGDFFFIGLAAAISAGGLFTLGPYLTPPLLAFACAGIIGASANAFGRFLDRPSAIMQVPGLMLLVPGSVGFRGLAAMANSDLLSGLNTLANTAFIAIALVSGLLLANALVPPKTEL